MLAFQNGISKITSQNIQCCWLFCWISCFLLVDL